jgi:hypothetical protein
VMVADDEDLEKEPPSIHSSPVKAHSIHRLNSNTSEISLLSDLTASEFNTPLLTPKQSFQLSSLERSVLPSQLRSFAQEKQQLKRQLQHQQQRTPVRSPTLAASPGNKLTPTLEVRSIQPSPSPAAAGNNFPTSYYRGRSKSPGSGTVTGVGTRVRSKSPSASSIGSSSQQQQQRGRSGGFAFGRGHDHYSDVPASAPSRERRGRSKTPVNERERNRNALGNAYMRQGHSRSKSPSVTSSFYQQRRYTRSVSPAALMSSASKRGRSTERRQQTGFVPFSSSLMTRSTRQTRSLSAAPRGGGSGGGGLSLGASASSFLNRKLYDQQIRQKGRRSASETRVGSTAGVSSSVNIPFSHTNARRLFSTRSSHAPSFSYSSQNQSSRKPQGRSSSATPTFSRSSTPNTLTSTNTATRFGQQGNQKKRSSSADPFRKAAVASLPRSLALCIAPATSYDENDRRSSSSMFDPTRSFLNKVKG